MPVLVVQIGYMRMAVPEWLMNMSVAMGACGHALMRVVVVSIFVGV